MNNPKGVANFKRRTWDKDEVMREKQRREDGEVEEASVLRSESGGTFKRVKHALGETVKIDKIQRIVDLEKKVGSVEAATDTRSGYHCPVCDLTFADSSQYLSHVNSLLHNSKLGFSMNVSKSSVDQVKDRLKEKIKQELARKTATTELEDDFGKSYEEAEAKEKEAKRLKKEAKKARKAVVEVVEEEDEMSKVMGFKSFG